MTLPIYTGSSGAEDSDVQQRAHAAPFARLHALLQAGKQLAKAPKQLVEALASSTGLSSAGVVLALQSHLEHDATEAELMQLVRCAPTVDAIDVVLSSNVFSAAFRALALALARSAHVRVKPSKREPAFVRALLAAAPGLFEIDEPWQAHLCKARIVHAYGSDETLLAIRNALPTDVALWGHGAGFGVAIVQNHDLLVDAARRIASDVAAFDQRGCLSPRIVFATGDAVRASEIARALAAQLKLANAHTPRGELLAPERLEQLSYMRLAESLGDAHAGDGYLVGEFALQTLLLPPTGRVVHVCPVADLSAVAALLAPVHTQLTCVGCDDLALPLQLPRVRRARLGHMQRPRLDGPVDMRTTEPDLI